MAERTGARERERTPDPSTGSSGPGSADTPGEEHRPWQRRFIGSTPFLVLLAFAIAILVKTFLIQAFYIPSESMVPTLEVGDRVFVNKFVYDLSGIGRGDVIVFENPDPGVVPDRGVVGGFLHWLGEGIGVAQPEDEDLIKRVIALPGETIEIRDDVVYIDGEPIEESYLTPAARRATGDFPPTRVPRGSVFVMGDNRANSADSRYGLGVVPVDDVVGRAFLIVWPPSRIGGLG